MKWFILNKRNWQWKKKEKRSSRNWINGAFITLPVFISITKKIKKIKEKKLCIWQSCTNNLLSFSFYKKKICKEKKFQLSLNIAFIEKYEISKNKFLVLDKKKNFAILF